MTTTKQPNKYLSLVTYVIAVVCLLLGLLLPLYDGKMLAVMLPSALGKVITSISFDIGTEFTNSIDVNFFGYTIDFGALTVLLYALITVIGLIMLIPVIASKKNTHTARVCSSIVEVVALIVLFAHIFNQIGYNCLKNDAVSLPWAIVIAAAGTALMLIIQAFGNLKGSGVMKVIMLILSAVCVVALLEVTLFASIFKSAYGSINGLLLIGTDGVTALTGFDIVTYFVQYTFCSADAISSVSALSYLTVSTKYIFGTSTAAILATWFVTLTVLLALVNFAIDIISTGVKTKKCGLVFASLRYVVEVVCAVVSVILLFIIDGAEPGILLYVILGVAVVEAIISIIRSAVYQSEKEKLAGSIYATPAENECVDDTIEHEYVHEYIPQPAPAPAPQPAPVYVQCTPATCPAVQPAPAPAPVPAPESQVIYKVKEVYSGPTDSFISRLNDSERIEFSKLFIEKIHGSYENVPDYVVGGDNKDFFTAIFVYLGKFRPMISDGLMNKIYNELNLLN